MGFPHCPICVCLAFISASMGITRGFMVFILLKELIKEEFKLNLNLS